MEALTLNQKIELQFNTARVLLEKWTLEGCNKSLKLKFPRNLIECTYDGKLKFTLKVGIGTGKAWKTFDNIREGIIQIAGSTGHGFTGKNGFELVTKL